jgi:hypothetical protein
MTNHPLVGQRPTVVTEVELTLMTGTMLFGLLLAAITGTLSLFTSLTQSLTVVWGVFGVIGLLLIMILATQIYFRPAEHVFAIGGYLVGFLFPTVAGIVSPGWDGTVISWIGFIVLYFLIFRHYHRHQESETD